MMRIFSKKRNDKPDTAQLRLHIDQRYLSLRITDFHPIELVAQVNQLGEKIRELLREHVTNLTDEYDQFHSESLHTVLQMYKAILDQHANIDEELKKIPAAFWRLDLGVYLRDMELLRDYRLESTAFNNAIFDFVRSIQMQPGLPKKLFSIVNDDELTMQDKFKEIIPIVASIHLQDMNNLLGERFNEAKNIRFISNKQATAAAYQKSPYQPVGP